LLQQQYKCSHYTSYIDLPHVVQRFFDIPDNIDLNDVDISDPSITESSSSPHLTPSDNEFLDPEYWLSHPIQYAQLKQHFLPYKLRRNPSDADLADEL